MVITSDDLVSFWSSAWSVSSRSACRWLSPEVKTRVERGIPVPRWLGPQFLQRWVGQAIQDRFTWQRAHPDAAAYRYPDDSAPCWEALAPVPYERGWVRDLEDDYFLRLWGYEAERLMRLLDVPPVLVGQDEWTSAVLGLCEHLARLYAELKRRYRARQARAMLREALAQFVVWDYTGEAA